MEGDAGRRRWIWGWFIVGKSVGGERRRVRLNWFGRKKKETLATGWNP
jgi:hypothetical protein